MKLVADWKRAWTWNSVHAMTAAIALQGAWAAIPDDLKMHVPGALVNGVTVALLVLGVVGRLRDQGSPKT